MTRTWCLLLAWAALVTCTAAQGEEVVTLASGEVFAPPPAAACDELCDNWCPLWTIRAGAVILTRTDPEDPTGLLTALGGGETPEFDWAAGPDISIIRHCDCCTSVEVRYFGALDFQIDEELDVLGAAIDVGYSSRLNSTEINLRRAYSDRITWLAGFRWIELHELIAANIDAGIAAIDLDVNTDNHLYGGQVGADVNLIRDWSCWSVDAVFKAGVYADFADRDLQVAINGFPIANAFQDDDEGAFVGEIGITAAYDLSHDWAVRGGYQLLWINGAALADEQITPDVEMSGDVLYHGALLGLERSW
jgi:hypothetical protein